MSDKISGTGAADLIAKMREQGRLEPAYDTVAAGLREDDRVSALGREIPPPVSNATADRARDIREELMRREVLVRMRSLADDIGAISDTAIEVPETIWGDIDLLLLLRREAG